jgi:hypothetical protein
MLRDVMSAAGLTSYAELSLLLFMATFIAIVLWVLLRPREQVQRWSKLPLRDDVDPAPEDDTARTQGDGR